MMATSQADVHTPFDVGPVMQYQLKASELNLPASVPASGNVSSNVIPTTGYKSFAVSVTSTQAGTLTAQRYLDQAGTIPQGVALTAAVSASTAVVLNSTDDVPFQSVKFIVSNSGSSAATLSGVIVVLQAQ